MLVNSSFSSEVYSHCSNSKDAFFISTGMIAVKTVLVLLLCTFILYLGYQRWRQHHSSKTATHSDLFTYHLAAMELFWCPGFLFYVFGNYSNSKMKVVAYCCFAITLFGEMLFHLLTCAEWYLAVVHPVTYLSLRKARGVRIRNISIGSVWLMCFGMMNIYLHERGEIALTVILSSSVVSIVVVTFCSISVLRVLSPQTGKHVEKKRRINQLKLRAFYNITAISCVLWLWFGGIVVSYPLIMSRLLSNNANCVLIASMNWVNLPSSLVSPLLYLHGAGKLFCNCYKSE